MLRLLIKTLRPTENDLRKRKPSFSLKTKIWFHRCLVKMLAHFYRRYAIHDILSLTDGTRVEIEFRDPEFEIEAACAKLETKQQLQPVRTLPQKSTQQKRGVRWFNRCFNWHHRVTVADGAGKTVVIEHTSQMSLSGNMRIRAELANPDSLINTVKLTHSTNSQRTTPVASQQVAATTTSEPRRSSKRRRRRLPPPNHIPGSVIPGNKTLPSPEANIENPNDDPQRAEPKDDITRGESPVMATKPVQVTTRPLKKMKGYELDDSF